MQNERLSYMGEPWSASESPGKCVIEPPPSVVDDRRVVVEVDGALEETSSMDIDRSAARRAAMSKLPETTFFAKPARIKASDEAEAVSLKKADKMR